MRKIILLVAIALSCVCWACYDNEIAGPDAGQACLISLSGEIDQVTLSRVNDGGFCHNDVMGVYIVDYEGGSPGTLLDEGNRATNLQFTFDEANYKWNSAYDVFWKDSKTPIDVYGYYPVGTPESVNAYAFEVRKDQSKLSENGEMGGYEASDFLWATDQNVTASDSPVSLSFKHRMSKMVVRLMKGKDYDGDIPEDAEVYIHNTVPSATIDLSVGIVTRNTHGTAQTIKAKKVNKTQYTAIVVPQRLTNQVPLVEVVMKGVSYMVESKFVFKPGIQHMLSVTISKNPEQVKIEIGGEIEDWED